MSDPIERDLEDLNTAAPAWVFENIMVGTGLWDEYAVVDGPIEPMYVAWNPRGITTCIPVSVVGSDDAFEESHPRPARPAGHVPAALDRKLARALATGRLGNLPIDLSALGSFQRAVLEKCAEIPPGEIRPYGWIAAAIGNPGAVRAVGTALGRNPVPILIPCHRVVRTDGRIGNYAYGTGMKRELLEAEGLDVTEIEETAGRNVRFVGSETTGVYCYPTCRHGRRISERNRLEFRSADEAERLGYRGCKVCRPIAA